MKYIKLSLLLIFIGLLLLSHATPKMAVRSNVFLNGYPISAINADIINYEYSDGEKGLKITNPPIERATEGELDTYVISKKWGFYFAEFRKDI